MDSDWAGLDGFRRRGGLDGRRVAGFRAQDRRAQGAEAQSAEAQRRRDAEAQGRRVQSAEAQRRRGAGGKNFGQNVLGVATKKAPSSFLGLERA